MKTTVSHPQTQATTVPHFVALLGVLHEAATRGLSLLPEEPAPRHAARPGTAHRRLGRSPLHLLPSWKAAAAGARP